MLNWEVPADALAAFVPRATTIDLDRGRAFVSLVAFRMRDTRLLGVRVPFHADFEEVNLRHYVRHGEERGVAFVKEIVPRRALAWVARVAYNERYVARRMSHVERNDDVAFSWREGDHDREQSFAARKSGSWREPGAHERFIIDHHAGYAAQRDGGTIEYRVEHAPWRVAAVDDVRVDVDFVACYGALGAHIRGPPTSAFLVDGSDVTVSWPHRIAK
jgi:uncharacterized protein YqjF (DUF2071 family)